MRILNISSKSSAQLYDSISDAHSTRFIGRAAVDYKIHGLENLRVNMSAGLDITVTDSYNGVVPGSFQAYTDTSNLRVGQYSKGYNLSRSQLLEMYLNYNNAWGIHNLDLMAGYSWQNNYWANRSINYFLESTSKLVYALMCPTCMPAPDGYGNSTSA